jgi:hypothetical protein
MTNYRLYFFGAGRGPAFDFRDFEVADEAAAIAAAQKLHRIGAMELWCAGRKIRHWGPAGAVPPRSLASLI